jgi:uncharacterized membrane protein
MARKVPHISPKRQSRMDTPLSLDDARGFGRFRSKSPRNRRLNHTLDNSFGGRLSESIAYFLGTPRFIAYLTIFCIVWIAWNTMAPDAWRFDSSDMGFTALTLMLSLQASYAAPLILLAQNRQTDRDKISMEQDRERAERNLIDTEYLMREIASIRMQLGEIATRDYIRTELREILDELDKRDDSVTQTANQGDSDQGNNLNVE